MSLRKQYKKMNIIIDKWEASLIRGKKANKIKKKCITSVLLFVSNSW